MPIVNAPTTPLPPPTIPSPAPGGFATGAPAPAPVPPPAPTPIAPIAAAVVPAAAGAPLAPEPASDELPVAEIADTLHHFAQPTNSVTLYGEEEATLQDAFMARVDAIGVPALEKRAELDPNSYEHQLTVQYTHVSAEAERAQMAIAALPDKEKFATQLRDADGKVLLGRTASRPKHGGGRTVDGPAGLYELARRTGGVRRYPLYNSGFTVDLRRPQAVDVHNALDRIHYDLQVYGRQLGAVYYMYTDLLVKQGIIQMFPDMIVAANAEDWNNFDSLIDHLKLPDVNVITWALASTMYDTGWEHFRHACTEPTHTCTHVSETTLDLSKMLYTNYAPLTPAAVQHMGEAIAAPTAGTFTAEKLRAYNAELKFDGEQRAYGKFRFTLRVPTVRQFLDSAADFNIRFTNEVQAVNIDAVYTALEYRYYRVFAPWIAHMEVFTDETRAELDIQSSDRRVIESALDSIQSEDGENAFEQLMTEYINAVTLSHVAYPVFPCPACGHEPKTPSGFFTVDPQLTFFTLLRSRSIQS